MECGLKESRKIVERFPLVLFKQDYTKIMRDFNKQKPSKVDEPKILIYGECWPLEVICTLWSALLVSNSKATLYINT